MYKHKTNNMCIYILYILHIVTDCYASYDSGIFTRIINIAYSRPVASRCERISYTRWPKKILNDSQTDLKYGTMAKVMITHIFHEVGGWNRWHNDWYGGLSSFNTAWCHWHRTGTSGGYKVCSWTTAAACAARCCVGRLLFLLQRLLVTQWTQPICRWRAIESAARTAHCLHRVWLTFHPNSCILQTATA